MPLKLRSPRNLQPFFRSFFSRERGGGEREREGDTPLRVERADDAPGSNRIEGNEIRSSFSPFLILRERNINFYLSISRALPPERGRSAYVVKRTARSRLEIHATNDVFLLI